MLRLTLTDVFQLLFFYALKHKDTKKRRFYLDTEIIPAEQ